MQISTSNKIVCLARSFRLHAAELGNEVPGEPLYFLKAPSAVIGPGDAIVLPPESGDVQHEAEVAILIGRRLSRADEAEVEAAITGWTVLNDVTARDVQKADGGRFTRAKGFDTFCPIGDAQLPKLDWQSARVQCFVNGQKRQDGGLTDLLWPPATAVAAISKCMTLLPGDVVSLGTPAGVSALQPGDEVEVRLVDGDGATLLSLRNPVIAASTDR